MANARTRSRRSIRGARERFAAGERGSPPVRGEILDSWRRSRSCGVVPDRPEVPFDERHEFPQAIVRWPQAFNI